MDSKSYHLFVIAVIIMTFARWDLSEGSLFQQMSTDRVRPVLKLESGQRQLVPGLVSLQSLSSHAQLGPRSDFRYAGPHIHKSPKGVKRVRLQQTYGGYDVVGSSVSAEMDLDERFTGQMYGDVVRNLDRYISDPKACERNIDELHVKAIKSKRLSLKDPNIQKQDGQRVIFIDSLSNKARLAYQIQFFYSKGQRVFYPVYFFDACNGKVLTSYDQITTMMATESHESLKPDPKYFRQSQERVDLKGLVGDADNNIISINGSRSSGNPGAADCPVSANGLGGNPKIGRISYNNAPYCLDVRKTLAFCRMDGSTVRVVDNDQSSNRRNRNIVDFLCVTGYRDTVNDAYGIANDALYNGELFGTFFQDKYGIEALKYEPRVVVHFDRRLENAFADGTDTYFGDGDNTFYPLVTLDIVAHELAHLITRRASDLIYKRMSGGINEAFSDITAVTTRAYALDTGSPSWTIGANAYKRSGALRYLDDPTRDGKSIKSIFGYRPTTNVHQSSGVFNYAFYSMVKDEGINIFEAYKSFLDANLNSWKPWTNFFTGACDVVQAAYDNGYEYRGVRSAFRRTGIPLMFCRPSALTTTMHVGETREEILVSATRSPIIKVDLEHADPKSTTAVLVTANDFSKIAIAVSKDDEASRIITRGDNMVLIESSLSSVYVKLSSGSKVDIPVKMAVEG